MSRMTCIFLLKMPLYLLKPINHYNNKRIGRQIIENLKEGGHTMITVKEQATLLKNGTNPWVS